MSWRAFKFYLLHPIVFLRRIGHAIYEMNHPDEPWLSQGAVRFLEDNLKPEMHLFEWGSGCSTLWFANRVKKVVSIEYNGDWAKKVSESITKKNIENVDLRYVPLEHPYKAPTQKHYDKTPNYVSELFKFEKESFDVILIDGHYRLTCADHCFDYIKPGGYLVIDNSNRSSKKDWAVPESWPLLHESENVMTCTSIWQKT